MKRRDFLKGAATSATVAVVGGSAATQLAAPAIAQGKMEWRMVTTWPKNFPGLGTAASRLAQRIGDMTDGRLTVKVFGGGELVPPFEAFDAVAQGTAQMGHAAAYYWQGKSKATNFFTTVPFGLTADELAAWVYHGGGQELWDKLYADFGVKPFLSGNTGAQMGGWFRNEIKSLEDMQGLKFRAPGLNGEMYRRVGVNVVSLPGGEIFPALQAGTIDAGEWVGPWNDLAFGFHKVAKNYYGPAIGEPGSGLECTVNKEAYDGLPKDLQEVIRTACAAEVNAVLADFTANNGKALEELVTKHEVQVRSFPDDVVEAMGKAGQEILSEFGSADAITKEIYESFVAFRQQMLAWSPLAEGGYFPLRARALGA